MSNPQIASRTIKRKRAATSGLREPFQPQIPAPTVSENDIKIERTKTVQEFVTLAEKIARSSIYSKHWYVPNAPAVYAYRDWMRRVEKYFPYANGGPMLMDEPRDEEEHKDCLEKADYLKAMGYRYIILEKDTTLFDALSQIGEV